LGVWQWPVVLVKITIGTGWNAAEEAMVIAATGVGGTVIIVDVTGTNTTCKNQKQEPHGIR
jgi:hypothetical protein